MTRSALALALGLASACASSSSKHAVDPDVRGRELAHELILLDGHVDVPYRLHEQAKKGAAVAPAAKASKPAKIASPGTAEKRTAAAEGGRKRKTS